MAAKGAELVTLADVAKSKDKKIGKVAEVLTQHNAMNNDIPYQVMNEGTIHKEDIRSALPEVYYRKANQPIPASKTTIEERSFTSTHFESKSQIDKDVASRGGADRVAYNRWNQAQGHIQAQAIEQANLILYGSPADNNLKTAGLFDIYSTLAPTEETSKQIIDAGGVGTDNTSIVKVHWGERSVFGIYPTGTTAGITRIDHSKNGTLVQIHGIDKNGKPGTFWGYEEEFKTDHGLVVKDYRQAARIANIDVNLLKSGAMGVADLLDLMIDADYKIDSQENGQGVWYCNRTIFAHLHKQALNKVGAGGGLTFDNYQGKRVLMYLNCPVRLMDAIMVTEDRVVA
jgi:hypothetical protein